MMKKLLIFLFVLIVSIYSATLVQAVDYGEILSAETRCGHIAVSQIDSYTFSGNTGQTVIIQMSRLTNGYFDSTIDLYDPDNILEKSVGATNNNVLLQNYQLLQTGLYTIIVRDGGGNDSDDYCLSFLIIPGPTVSPQDPDGGDIISHELKEGRIDPADTDAYTFIGEAADTINIQMSRLTNGYFDSTIDLYDPDNILEKSVGATNNNVLLQNYQLLQTGLYTIIVRDGGGNDGDDYNLSFIKVPGTLQSPIIRLTLNNNSFQIGDTLIITASVMNGPDPVDVEVKTWIGLPSGDQIPILDSHFTFTVEPNADFTAEIFTYTFNGSEPSGNYNAGGRFLNPISGRELSANVESFTFSP